LQQPRVDRFQAFVWAVALHVAALVLLVVSLHFNKPQIITPPSSQVMNAVAVDQSKVEAEIKKLREQDQKKLEQQKNLEEKRKEEEKKIEELKQEKEKLKQQKEEEQARLKEAEAQKQEQEKEKAKIEAEKQKALDEKKQLEEEKKQAEEQKRKAEADKKRQEQEKKKAVETQKRQEAEDLEKQRQQELEAEEKAQEAEEQAKADRSLIDQYVAQIKDRIQGVFINPVPEQDLSCKIFVRLSPAGDVLEAKIVESSGNSAFDQQAQTAVFAAQPLPVPADSRIFDRMRAFNFIFHPTR
jgi:colicin import membrane protein